LESAYQAEADCKAPMRAEPTSKSLSGLNIRKNIGGMFTGRPLAIRDSTGDDPDSSGEDSDDSMSNEEAKRKRDEILSKSLMDAWQRFKGTEPPFEGQCLVGMMVKTLVTYFTPFNKHGESRKHRKFKTVIDSMSALLNKLVAKCSGRNAWKLKYRMSGLIAALKTEVAEYSKQMEQHREDRDDAGLYNGTAFGMQQKTVIADLIESKGTEWIGKLEAKVAKHVKMLNSLLQYYVSPSELAWLHEKYPKGMCLLDVHEFLQSEPTFNATKKRAREAVVEVIKTRELNQKRQREQQKLQLEEEERKLQIEVLDKKKKNIRARTYKDQSPATHGETPKSPARHNETPKSPAKPKTPKNKGPLSPKKKETHPKKHRTKHPTDLFANDNDNHVTHAIEI